jgi:anti-sigma factor RsiW
MTMNSRISPQDIELLSAYLDQQLDSRQLVGLETRLKSDPELRQLLNDLRRTRRILRSTPPIKAPRKFTLTPQMEGIRPPRRVYPMFQFASAIAGLLLVIALLGDFLGFGSLAPASPVPEAAREQVVVESTVSVESRAKGIDTQEITSTETLAEALPLVVAAPGSTGESADRTTEALATPTMSVGLAAVPLETVTDTPVPTGAPQETPTPEAVALAPLVSGGETSTTPVETPAQVGNLYRIYWRIAEVTLALAALVCGLAAVILRRRYPR